MLQSLDVRDFAIIDRVELEFAPGLTVLTGETGAGKSILVGALQLLLGDRASTDLVRAGASRAAVQGTFLVADGQPVEAVLEQLGVPLIDGMVIARREISAEGRSRAYLNDVAVTVGALKKVGERLVDLHGQHDHQSLLQPAQHLLLLDAWADLSARRVAFADLLGRLRDTTAELSRLRGAMAEDSDRRELQAFQLKEILELDPTSGELDELEREVRKLEGGERLASGLTEVLQGLSEGEGPLLDRLGELEETAASLSAIDEGIETLGRLLADARLTLQEGLLTAQRLLDGLDLDRDHLEQVRERHSALILLVKKHGGSMEALLSRKATLEAALARSAREQEDLPHLEKEAERLLKEASAEALALHATRATAVAELERQVVGELADLSMPDAEFSITVEARVADDGLLEGPDGIRYLAGSTGVDRVEFGIRTNPGAPLLPLQKVASGGEVSRVMLALKSAFGGASDIPTLIFDEIDSGIGGRTADRVGGKLANLAGRHQVVAITHLPQIARRGDRHLVVEKTIESEGARTRIRVVEGDERSEIIAVLMSGENAPAVLEHARNLLGGGRGGDQG